jgi:glycosyltransferase involved in cell wall biosynthesis
MPPTASYALFTYRQAAWAAEALLSAVAQDAEGLEILVYDDGSDDGTFELLRGVVDAYRGPHAVRLSTDRTHRGLTAQINRAAREASGDLIVVAAGDDVARPDRVRRLLALFTPGVTALHSNATVMDADGTEGGLWFAAPPATPSSWTEVVDGRWQLFGAAAAYDRSLLLANEGLLEGVVAEDLALSMRAVRAGRVVFVDEPLVRYRRHDRNVSLSSDGLDDPGRYRRHLAHRALFLEGANRQWASDLRATARAPDDHALAVTCERRSRLASLAGAATVRALSARELVELARHARWSDRRGVLRTLAMGTLPGLFDFARRMRR